jgi:hypothetical protein
MAYIPEGARWYLAEVVLEHRIENDPTSVVHINLHLVEAGSPDEAYRKAIALGRQGEMDYRNTEGKRVCTTFRGLRGLNVIHDDLEDGAELLFEELVGLDEDQVQQHITPYERLAVFAPRAPRTGGPNYMPEDVMKMLEEAGFDDDAVA